MKRDNLVSTHSFSELFAQSLERTLLITKDQKISGRKILKDVTTLRRSVNRNGRYGLKLSDPYFFILTMACLDGFVDTLFILPSGIDGPDDLGDIITDNFVSHALKEGAHLKKTGETDLDSLDTSWFLYTSGTTAKPKMIRHTRLSLTSNLKIDQKVGLGLKWGLLYNLSSFSGLQVILQSLLGWGCLIIPPLESISKSVEFLSMHLCNSLSATPSLWKKILMTPLAPQLQLKSITLGGEIADQKILSSLEKRFPDAMIRHIYASTEAGVGFSVSDRLEGFPTDYLSQFNLKVDKEGMLYVKPKLPFKSVTEDHAHYITKEGYIKTLDIVKKRGDRYIFLGRENGSINIGGQKVFPENVERILSQVDEIESVLVQSKKSAFLGSLILAHVKLKKGITISTELIKEKIISHCHGNLKKYEIPYKFNFVDDIEVNNNGKIKRT